MPSINREDVEKALATSAGGPVVKYNRTSGTFTLMNIFFRTVGQVGTKTLSERLKRKIPDAEVLSAWTKNREKNRGLECVEFRV